MARVRFTEHHKVVENFVRDRADEPLNVPVLPQRAWRGRVIATPYCANAMLPRNPVASQNLVRQKSNILIRALIWGLGEARPSDGGPPK
jgi:hypothetical protein